MQYFVYILASNRNGTLYVGITSNLVRRIYEHKSGLAEGFTKEYGVYDLVYFETHDNINEALLREKQMKKWNRQWKIRIIEEMNPKWQDLYSQII